MVPKIIVVGKHPNKFPYIKRIVVIGRGLGKMRPDHFSLSTNDKKMLVRLT